MDSQHEGKSEASMEVQLGGRHLTLAVAGLIFFGLVLFLLGRWSERVARPERLPSESVSGGNPSPGTAVADPAAAPRDLTFYETLGKKTTPSLQEAAKPSPSRREAPAELPPSTPLAAAETSPKKTDHPDSPSGATPAGGERYRVQVASTRDLASARLLVDRLRKKGYAASIDAAQGPEGSTQYKVRIGNYSDRAPAEKVAEKVREEEKVGAWIVKVQG